jgi:hypothetical protein
MENLFNLWTFSLWTHLQVHITFVSWGPPVFAELFYQLIEGTEVLHIDLKNSLIFNKAHALLARQYGINVSCTVSHFTVWFNSVSIEKGQSMVPEVVMLLSYIQEEPSLDPIQDIGILTFCHCYIPSRHYFEIYLPLNKFFIWYSVVSYLQVILGHVTVIVLAIGHKVCGFKPGQERWIFMGNKNL